MQRSTLMRRPTWAWAQASDPYHDWRSIDEIEELVADHRPGDHPEDPAVPEARIHVVRLELSAETFAALRQARGVLDDEHGSHLSDDQLIAAMCGALLDGTSATEPAGLAKFQIAVTVCERCHQGWQDGAGAKIAISPAAVERATCDAQHIGSVDSAIPERAHQDIPPSVARLVWRRDGGRCRVPGCRSARALEIHHLIRRIDGGSHDACNLCLLCSSCHRAHHNGILTIKGTADHLEVARPDRSSTVAKLDAHVGAPTRLDVAVLYTEAKEALIGLGWKPAIAKAAVASASAALGTAPTLERLICEALRRCAQPPCCAV